MKLTVSTPEKPSNLLTHPDSSLYRWGDTVDEIFMMWIAETPATDERGQCTLGGAL